MSIVSGPPLVLQVVPAHSPLGKPAVGLESAAHKDSPLPPVEDATPAERLHYRDVIVKLSGDAEGESRRHPSDSGHPDPEQSEEEPVDEPLVLAGATAAQARHLAEFEATPPPPGTLLDQTI